MQAFFERKRATSPLSELGARSSVSRVQSMPNSAMQDFVRNSGAAMSAVGSKEDIAHRFSGTGIKMQEQIPQAEREADRLSAAVTSGTPDSVKAAMGQRLGADFSGVRFHTGEDAAAKADAMGARAFTSGSDVYFGQGGFDASVAAHELVHTAQQGVVDSSTPTMSTPVGGVQMKSRKEEKGESFGEASWRRFKNIGHIISGGGRLAKNFVVDKAKSVQRKHHRAVDQYNLNREDYKDMSGWERFKWVLKNPLARISADYKKQDSLDRRAREEELDAKAKEIAANANYDLGDAGYDPRADEYYQPQVAAEQEAQAGGSGTEGAVPGGKVELNDYNETIPGKQEVFDHVGGSIVRDKVLGITNKAGVIGGKALSKPAKSVSEVKLGEDLGAVDQVFGGLGGVAGTVGYGARAAANIMRTRDAAKTGNWMDTARNGLIAGADIGRMAGSAAKGIAYLSGSSGAVEHVAGGLVPGLGIVAGGAKFASGLAGASMAGYTRERMKTRMAEMQKDHDDGKLSRDDERYYRTLNQAKRLASVRALEGGFEMGSGALRAAGSAATLAGASAPVGAMMTGAGVATDVVKGLVTGKMKKTRRADVVEEELGLKEKITNLERQGYSSKDAKHLVLKSMGFNSGTRKEAFQHITMKRASELHKRANSGDEDARHLMHDLGLIKSGGSYSLQGIAEKLGMESGSTWQTQMADTAHSRDKNMFKIKADKNRKEVAEAKAKEAEEKEKKQRKEAMAKYKKAAKMAAKKAKKAKQ